MKKDHILITGASGFVGASLTRRCVLEGQKVTILTRNKKPNWRLRDIEGKFTIVQTDLLDPKLSSIVETIQPTVVIHCAAYGGMPQETEFKTMVSTNMLGLHNLIDSLKNIQIRLFINTGSSSEYGIYDKPVKESYILKPINGYGVIKAGATLYCEERRIRDKLPIITLRLFSPYGPYEQLSRLIPTLCKAATTNDKVVLSSPFFVRDFIFIDDVVDAYIACLRSKTPTYGIFNVGTGKQHSIGDIVSIIENIVGKQLSIVWNVATKQKRQVEPKYWQADISKIKNSFFWKPKHTINIGLKKTLDWYKSHTFC